MDRTTRAVVAFAVAPLAPACLSMAYVALTIAPKLHALWDLLVATFLIAALFTYSATLAIGVPAYLLINRSQTLRRQHVLVISGAAGAIVGLLFGSLPLGVLLGVSAGVTFCLIWYRARDERPF